MSNAEQSAEPSMEDILSSIRKIIAEEPDGNVEDSGAAAAGDKTTEQSAAAQLNVGPGTQSSPPTSPPMTPAATVTTPSTTSPSQATATEPHAAKSAPTPIVETASPVAAQDDEVPSAFQALITASDPEAQTVAVANSPETPSLDGIPVSADEDKTGAPARHSAQEPQSACPADPDDLDPLASLIDQVPGNAAKDHTAPGNITPSDPGHGANLAVADVPKPVLDNNRVPFGRGDSAPPPAVNQQPASNDMAQVKPELPQQSTEQVAVSIGQADPSFMAPKPAELRGALTGRQNTGDGTNSNGDRTPLTEVQEQTQPASVVAEAEPPLSDLLKTLAGTAEPTGDRSNQNGDHVAPPSVDDAQAAVEASTRISREKLSETLNALNASADDKLVATDKAVTPPHITEAAVDTDQAAFDNATSSAGPEAALRAGAAGDGTDNVAGEKPLHDASTHDAASAQPAEELDMLESLLGSALNADSQQDGHSNPASNDLPDGNGPVVAFDSQAEKMIQGQGAAAEPVSQTIGLPLDKRSKEPMPAKGLTSTDAAPNILPDTRQETVAEPLPSKAVTVAERDQETGDVAESRDIVPGEVRTMEDTVSELLRPMLRNWLDDNMPRILEKTLKMELAAAIEPDADDDKSG